MTAVTWERRTERRLPGTGWSDRWASLAAAAAAMAGAHAQVMSAAELSLALRVAGADPADVADRAVGGAVAGQDVRAARDGARAAAADLAWWLAALGSVPKQGGHPDGVRLTPDETDAVVGRSRCRVARGGPDDRGARRVRRRGVRRGRPRSRWRRSAASGRGGGWRCGGGGRCSASGRAAAGWPSREPEPLAARPGAARRRPRRSCRCCAPTSRRTARPRRRTWPGGWPPRRPGPRAVRARRPRGGRAATASRRGCCAATRTFDAAEAPAVRLLPYFDAFRVGSQPRRLLFPGRASERALAGQPGRQLPGAAARRSGRRCVAPEAVRPQGRGHRRAARRG